MTFALLKISVHDSKHSRIIQGIKITRMYSKFSNSQVETRYTLYKISSSTKDFWLKKCIETYANKTQASERLQFVWWLHMRRLNVISLDTSIREEGYRKEKKGHETGEPQKDPNRDTVSRHGEKTGSVDYTISRHSPVVHAITKDYGKHASKTQTASKDMKISVRSGV